MIEKKNTPIMIVPEEIVSICDRAGTIDSINMARLIEQAFMELESTKTCHDQTWNYYRLISTIYDAGRIQGIREERAHRRGATISKKKELTREEQTQRIMYLYDQMNDENKLKFQRIVFECWKEQGQSYENSKL
ncbi:hypothetical protein [Ruminococcus flavefaciens]|uniref:hypothetical protein n=1 Tax=Ruminococcus flavefaciens TaxID=1265 RepID=UPI0004901C1F|nr:hypothetical protein [Ruminococcus flavefaciens]